LKNAEYSKNKKRFPNHAVEGETLQQQNGVGEVGEPYTHGQSWGGGDMVKEEGNIGEFLSRGSPGGRGTVNPVVGDQRHSEEIA